MCEHIQLIIEEPPIANGHNFDPITWNNSDSKSSSPIYDVNHQRSSEIYEVEL